MGARVRPETFRHRSQPIEQRRIFPAVVAEGEGSPLSARTVGRENSYIAWPISAFHAPPLMVCRVADFFNGELHRCACSKQETRTRRQLAELREKLLQPFLRIANFPSNTGNFLQARAA
jgi:hypothetical protein